jgi:putative ABC transport system permease protein
VKALDRKLLRDLRALWSQALTIALVVASGLGGFLTSLSAVDSLAAARDRFYVEGRFADLFVSLKRAPLSLLEVLQAESGVADLQATVEHDVRVELDGVVDPVIGRLIGIDPRSPPRLNTVVVRSGRLPQGEGARGDGELEAVVLAGFAQARGLRPGDRLTALINGKRRTLSITGVALSPEYVFAGLAGLPDLRGFGVFWVDHRALAAAYDMQGAFNRLAVRLAPGADAAGVAAALDRRLARYGAREVIGRADQPSHAMLENEIKEQRVLGTVLPSIFLAVAAFLLNVVIARLVATQREQIASLKALGYGNRRIFAHYLEMVALIVAAGLAIGIALGRWLGGLFIGLYADFFHFPVFEHRMDPTLVTIGAAVCAATAVLGTLNAIWATVRLRPAEAMRPPAPGRYRRTLVERAGIVALGTTLRMVLRNMERRPWRTLLSIGGVAAAVAIVVMGNFFRDAIDVIVDTQFNLALRADVVVWMAEPTDDGTRHALARLPGVVAVESGRDIPVRFVHGHRSERGSIQGFATPPRLRRVIDVEGRAVAIPPDGLVMTDRLAAKLGLRVGEPVRIETLDGRRRTILVPLAAVVREMLGLNAYMGREALNALLGEGDLSAQYALALERGAEPRFLAAAREMPKLAGTFSKATLRQNLQEVSARNVRIMSTLLTVFASVIAVGVVYNNARIALAERTWELASLRVLGFTRGEVSAMLLGEQAIGIAIALPIGMLAGWGLVDLIAYLLRSDQFDFPVVIRARTYAWAGLCVVAAGVASAWVVRRRIDRLDMVAALKTRE